MTIEFNVTNNSISSSISQLRSQLGNEAINKFDLMTQKIECIIVSFGFVLNSIAIYILSRKQLIKQNFNFYLFVLAVNELVFCIYRFLLYFHNNYPIFSGITIIEEAILRVFNDYLDFNSIWVALLSSLDRYYAILFPLKIKSFITYRSSKLLLIATHLIVAILTLAGHMPALYLIKKNIETSYNIDNFDQIAVFSNISQNILTPIVLCLIPAIGIVWLNTLLAITLIRYEKCNHGLLSYPIEQSVDDSTMSGIVNNRAISRRQRSYIFVLICLALLVVFCNLPFYIMLGLHAFNLSENILYFVFTISLIVSASHCINTFIYIAFHNDFRCYFLRVFLKPCLKDANN